MLEAANVVPIGFKIVLSLDALILKNTSVGLIVVVILKLAKNPVLHVIQAVTSARSIASEQSKIGLWSVLL